MLCCYLWGASSSLCISHLFALFSLLMHKMEIHSSCKLQTLCTLNSNTAFPFLSLPFFSIFVFIIPYIAHRHTDHLYRYTIIIIITYLLLLFDTQLSLFIYNIFRSLVEKKRRKKKRIKYINQVHAIHLLNSQLSRISTRLTNK